MNLAVVGDVVSHKKGFAFKSRDYSQTGIPLVKVSDFDSDTVSSSSTLLPESFTNEYADWSIEKDDILIATVGSWGSNPNSVVGKVVRVAESVSGALLNQNTVRLRTSGSFDQRFLFYCLKQNAFKVHCLSSAQGSANQASITLNDIKRFPLPNQSVASQKAIAHILGTLDDKIELNQKMNQTLEEIAKAIFKSWFVDFDPVRAKAEGRPTGLPAEISDLFPDELVDSEIGEIPKGWDVAPFTETFEFFSGGTPKTSVEEYWGGDVPWFSIADLNASSPWVTETEKSITELGLSKCSAKLIGSGTTIITARGTVGKVALAGQDMAINQSCYAMAPATRYPNSWLYLQTLALVERLRANAHGSVFDTITRKTFDQFSVLSAPSEVLKKFGEMTAPIFERMKTADLESKTLSELRDTLLPKLISGKLRIPDAEKFLEEAGI
jgi:type I restriction enzyme S subunit